MESDERAPHPLAIALIERLQSRAGARVLEIGAGSGRNTAALKGAGFDVYAVSDAELPGIAAPGQFDAALSTHGFLHGTAASAAQMLDAVTQRLVRAAPLYATFASVRDARFGNGTRIDDETFAPDEGDEIGVAHVYFTEMRLRELLERRYTIESMEERDVDEVAGRWAHAQKPHGSVHWFVQATRS
jgi:hypothetical protein